MIPTTDLVTPRFQLAVLAAILCQSLHSVAMPTIISAAEQEPPPRHSLIQRSAAESASLPATTQGTILQPSGTEPTHIASPIEPHKPSVSISPAPIAAPRHRTLTKRPAIATITAPATASQTPLQHRYRVSQMGRPHRRQPIPPGTQPLSNDAPHKSDNCDSSWNNPGRLYSGGSDRFLSAGRSCRRSFCSLSG